jgi:hypothetical protein
MPGLAGSGHGTGVPIRDIDGTHRATLTGHTQWATMHRRARCGIITE